MMNEMKQVALFIKQIRNTPSSNAKANLMTAMKNKNDMETEVFKKVMYYTYNTFMMYGLTEKTLQETKPKKMEFKEATYYDIFSMLDELATSNINDALRSYAVSVLHSIKDEDVREMVKNIMVKDQKMGANISSINKVFGKDFLPVWKCQLAESYAKQTKGLQGQEFWVTPKLDGCRVFFLPDSNKFVTRKGIEYEGLGHLVEEAKHLATNMLSTQFVVLDGELIHEPVEGLNSGELYALTSSIARKKGEHPDKQKLQFNVFDIIPLDAFQNEGTTVKYSKRRELLDYYMGRMDYKKLVRVPVLYHGTDESVIPELLANIEQDGGEGLMINLDAPYQFKRSKNVLKVKSFFSADVLVTDVYEGKPGTRFEGTLGGLVVKFLYNGEEMYTNVGSGPFKEERAEWWANPNLIIGKVITINYFEICENQKDTSKKDLRFATYQHIIRFDKDEDDITDVAITD